MDDIAVGATKEGGILVAITAADQGDANPCEVQVELTIRGAEKLKYQLEIALVAVAIPGKSSRVKRSAAGKSKKPTAVQQGGSSNS